MTTQKILPRYEDDVKWLGNHAHFARFLQQIELSRNTMMADLAMDSSKEDIQVKAGGISVLTRILNEVDYETLKQRHRESMY